MIKQQKDKKIKMKMKIPLRCLTGFQVRKIDDDTDNKWTSKFT